ncbi:MAG: hypothetical protein ACR2IE_07265 [Candidatus Sumerlaeaceae bacterium]
MYHVPARSKRIIVNPWPQAVRRILVGLGVLCLVAFLRSFLEWLFDHTSGDSRLAFNTISLVYLTAFIMIVVYLVIRRERSESMDSGAGQLRMFALNAFLATIAVYFLWDQQGLGRMFNDAAQEAYPYPYRGTILLMATWISIAVTLQMIGTVIIALKDARTNVYDQDLEPL